MDDDHIDAWAELLKILIGLTGMLAIILLAVWLLTGCLAPVHVTLYEVHKCGSSANPKTLMETGNDGNPETEKRSGLDSEWGLDNNLFARPD